MEAGGPKLREIWLDVPDRGKSEAVCADFDDSEGRNRWNDLKTCTGRLQSSGNKMR